MNDVGSVLGPNGEYPHRGLITVMIMLVTVMQVLDATIANVALPSMTGDLGASQDTITWVLTSHIVAAAIMTPVTGWMADRIGKRELFIVSIIGFVVASLLCGIAWNLSATVLFRLLQGIFGAAIVPSSQTFLPDINPREKQGSAMALSGAGIMVGPIIGPTLGGWLTESYNWRWVFLINLPIGIIATLGCIAYLPKPTLRLRRFDFFGFAKLSLGIGALQLILDRGARFTGSRPVKSSFARPSRCQAFGCSSFTSTLPLSGFWNRGCSKMPTSVSPSFSSLSSGSSFCRRWCCCHRCCRISSAIPPSQPAL